ncbi:glutamyl-tRNA reductase [soil metagenome]
MRGDLGALVAHAPHTSADQRAALAELLAGHRPPGALLLVTCHRVELYAQRGALEDVLATALAGGAQLLEGVEAARHMLRVAVGRESAVIGEDQILHQLREAVRDSRATGSLDNRLDRLADVALRAGRRARSWMPGQRGNVAELAIGRAMDSTTVPSDPALIVGSGRIARLAGDALRQHGLSLLVASRTEAHARALAAHLGAGHVAFDPGVDVAASLGGVVIGLAGAWPISPPTADALARSRAWVVDLSAPPALPDGLRSALGRRLITIDDLAVAAQPARAGVDSARLLARLDALVEQTLSEYVEWLAADAQRTAAALLNRRAAAAQSAELEQLWQRAPTLDERQREEVARAIRGLTRRLLGEPLERLGSDSDGRRAQAARDLFRL